jgi:stearoyl-CoA desaturase (delta-9 desaturase)
MHEAIKFLDADYFPEGAQNVLKKSACVNPSRAIPFVVLHLACLSVLWTGASQVAVSLAIILYVARMFFVTAFYHRYFSHRTFKTSRTMQFIFGALATTSVQRGPLWWAAHHRVHHKYSDQELDVHSPVRRGFFWSHIGWMMSDSNMPTDYSKVTDLDKFPELRLLNRFDWFFPIALGFLVYAFGEYMGTTFPSTHTSGWQCLSWGILSTVILFHATAAINSLAHIYGEQVFELTDNSKNNFMLAIFTMGEGWHNNHHKFPGIARQGLEWWQIDTTYYILLLMEKLGLIWDLRKVPVMKEPQLALQTEQ